LWYDVHANRGGEAALGGGGDDDEIEDGERERSMARLVPWWKREKRESASMDRWFMYET
jgi:hypothetical protein